MNDRAILFLIAILVLIYIGYHTRQWHVTTAPKSEILAPTAEGIARDIIAHPEKYSERSLNDSMIDIYLEANAYQPPTWTDVILFILWRGIGFIVILILIPIIAIGGSYGYPWILLMEKIGGWGFVWAVVWKLVLSGILVILKYLAIYLIWYPIELIIRGMIGFFRGIRSLSDRMGLDFGLATNSN